MNFISFNLEYFVDPIWNIGFEPNPDQKEEKPAGQAEKKTSAPNPSLSQGLDTTHRSLSCKRERFFLRHVSTEKLKAQRLNIRQQFNEKEKTNSGYKQQISFAWPLYIQLDIRYSTTYIFRSDGNNSRNNISKRFSS